MKIPSPPPFTPTSDAYINYVIQTMRVRPDEGNFLYAVEATCRRCTLCGRQFERYARGAHDASFPHKKLHYEQVRAVLFDYEPDPDVWQYTDYKEEPYVWAA